uniref:DNA repair protein rad9 n=1 Tax=Lygus hesperus TaxID=30085 RepID=A0A0A9ZA84_LYGHE
MSLYFSVMGANIRSLVSILSCACKLSDQVILVAHESQLEVLAVHSSASSHLSIIAKRNFFDKYIVQKDKSAVTIDEPGLGAPLFVCLSAKSVMTTLLRQNTASLRAVYFCHHYTGAEENCNNSRDEAGNHTQTKDD